MKASTGMDTVGWIALCAAMRLSSRFWNKCTSVLFFYCLLHATQQKYKVCRAYISNVPLQVYDSCHLLSDACFIDGQSTVRTDQLRQVNHELLIGLTCLSNRDSFIMPVCWAYFSEKKKVEPLTVMRRWNWVLLYVNYSRLTGKK